MAIPYYLLYHTCAVAQELEWATKYYIQGDNSDDVANTLANAERVFYHTSVTINRYEWFNQDGHKGAEGTFTGITGTQGGSDMMPIKYALLLRLQTGVVSGRPSTRYIHGWPESFQTNGVRTADFVDARQDYELALQGLPVPNMYVDSDGNPVNSHLLRGFSRRKRMRRKPM